MLKSPFLSKIRKRGNTKVKGDRAPYPAIQQRKVAGTHSLTMHHSPSALQVLPRVSLDEAFLQTYILWTKVPLSQKRCCTAVYRKTAGHHSACQGSGPASTVLIGQGSATPSALSVTTLPVPIGMMWSEMLHYLGRFHVLRLSCIRLTELMEDGVTLTPC